MKSRERLPSSPRVFDSHSTDILTKVLSLMWVMWALGVYTVVSGTTLKMWFGWVRFCFSASIGALAMNSCTSEKPTATARYRHSKLFTLYPKRQLGLFYACVLLKLSTLEICQINCFPQFLWVFVQLDFLLPRSFFTS